MKWRAFRKTFGSLFFGRRIEQSFGNWMAHYTRYKVKDGVEVNALTFMPHEEQDDDDELSLEEFFEKYHSGENNI